MCLLLFFGRYRVDSWLMAHDSKRLRFAVLDQPLAMLVRFRSGEEEFSGDALLESLASRSIASAVLSAVP